jgi:hypothetical protein
VDPPAFGTFGAGKRGQIGNAREDGRTSLSGKDLPSQLNADYKPSKSISRLRSTRIIPAHSPGTPSHQEQPRQRGLTTASAYPTLTSTPGQDNFKSAMAAALQQPPPAPPPTSAQDFIVPCQAVWGRPTQPEIFNPSHCHPVFFTAKLRRPPFNVLSGPQLNPVAHGYVYQDAPGRSGKPAGPRL